MSQYAQDTSVPVEKSRAELESILSRYGASKFGYMSTDLEAIVIFQAHGKFVKFILPLPSRSDRTFTHTQRTYLGRPTGPAKLVSPEACQKAWEQACRSRWRALCLCVKAKLEAVACGITTFEQEFLSHFVMPGGKTFGEIAIPQIETAVKTGRLPQQFQLM